MDLNLSKNLYNHITWRINRMTAGRILRKLFPKPTDTPNWWEQSTEKFIFFDEPKSPPYSLVCKMLSFSLHEILLYKKY